MTLLPLENPQDLFSDLPSLEQTQDSKPLVLIAEDHEDTRFMLKHVLEINGFNVAEAADGEEAVQMAESKCPNIVLIDVKLPHLDGLTATRRMRELAKFGDVPIVFLTAYAEPAFRAAALAAGGNDYLVKPLDITQLGAFLNKHLEETAGKRV